MNRRTFYKVLLINFMQNILYANQNKAFITSKYSLSNECQICNICCIDACPSGSIIFEQIELPSVYVDSSCIGCTECISVCPVNAIFMV